MKNQYEKEPRVFQKGEKILIAFASQTDNAKAFARRIFHQNDSLCDLVNLAEIEPAKLENYQRHIYIVSTFGNGEAPTEARPFAQAFDESEIDLDQVKFAVLALGNRQYSDFCGFGKHLTQQLMRRGADPRVPTTEVHRNDNAVFSHWWLKLAESFGIALEPDSDDWKVATVMDIEERAGSSIDLIFYVPGLEFQEAKALRFKSKRKNPNLKPFEALIEEDASNPFTRISITPDDAPTDRSGTIKLLRSSQPGDKWHVQVIGLESDD